MSVPVMMLLCELKFLSCAHKVQYAIEGESVFSKDIASKQTFKFERGWFENPTIVRTASHIFNTHTVYLITEFHKLHKLSCYRSSSNFHLWGASMSYYWHSNKNIYPMNF